MSSPVTLLPSATALTGTELFYAVQNQNGIPTDVKVLANQISSSVTRTGNLTLYVRIGGNDANPGTLTSPLATIQQGLNVLAGQIALMGGFGILNVGAGTFVGASVPYCIGVGAIQVYGAGSGSTIVTSNNVTANGDCFLLSQAFCPVFGVNNLTMQVNGGACIDIEAPVFVALGDFVGGARTDLIFDLTPSSFNFAIFSPATGATVSGNFGTTTALVKLANGSLQNPFFLQLGTVMADQLHWTVTVSGAGTASVGQWMRCDGECAYINGSGHASWTVTSGTITGNCFAATGGGAAFSQVGVGSLGPSFFPGSGFSVDSASTYDEFLFPTVVGSQSAINSDLSTSGAWALFKDTGTGIRAIQINDGATIYAKQIGRAVNKQTGASYTMVQTDQDGRVEMNNAGANTFTIPQDSAFSPAAPGVGTEVRVTQTGAGATTIAAGGGATVNNAGVVGGQWKSVLIYKTAANTWNQTSV